LADSTRTSAGSQADDVARHQFLQRELLLPAAAHYRSGVADHLLQLLGRVVGAHLLHESQHDAEYHHHENDRRRAQIAGQKRKHT